MFSERRGPAAAYHVIYGHHSPRQHLRQGAVLPVHLRGIAAVCANSPAADLPGIFLQPALQRQLVHRARKLHLRGLCQPNPDLPEHRHRPCHPVMSQR